MQLSRELPKRGAGPYETLRVLAHSMFIRDFDDVPATGHVQPLRMLEKKPRMHGVEFALHDRERGLETFHRSVQRGPSRLVVRRRTATVALASMQRLRAEVRVEVFRPKLQSSMGRGSDKSNF